PQATATRVAFAASLVSVSTGGNSADRPISPLTLSPGASGQFSAIFQNDGTNAWLRGNVALVTCCPIGTSPMAAWANGWVSTTTYAQQSNPLTGVNQGGLATFTFN